MSFVIPVLARRRHQRSHLCNCSQCLRFTSWHNAIQVYWLWSHRQLAHSLAALDPSDPVRHKHESLLLEKLYDMGILGTAGAGGKGKLSEVEKKVTVSSMCRRRLGVVMTRLKMADTVQAVRNSNPLPSSRPVSTRLSLRQAV